MQTHQWQRLNDAFHAAADLDPRDRPAFLASACAGDQELRAQVERLLQAHDRAALLDEAGEDAPAGRLVGPYRLIREIGRGGMGAVYLAERADHQYEKLVALKLIKRGMDTELVLHRFRAERQILASLDHPNIARLLDGGTTADGLPYFVMEYIEGQPIDDYATARNLSVPARLELFLQVASAVAYAHQHLVIHRDIKPLNILVTPDGVPKLLDFGIAKILDAEGGGDGLSTMTGMRLLTPSTRAPSRSRASGRRRRAMSTR